jgi:hypothetical protein
MGTVHEDPHTFMVISGLLLLRRRLFHGKFKKNIKNKHFSFNIFFENRTLFLDKVEKISYPLIRALQYDSVEIPTRYSFVIEFIITKFLEGSTCFERHTAHHQEL